MKHLKFFIIIILSVFLSSCSKNTVYKEYKDIKGELTFDFVSWKKTDVLVFEIILEKAYKGLETTISIRHAMHYPFSNMKITLECEMPDGKKTKTPFNLVLAENNMFKGSGMGDIWDIDIPVILPIKFDQKGTYKISINQDMMDKLPGVLEVGIILNKTEE
jgi:gliding motility-associated lipoprotein GldH